MIKKTHKFGLLTTTNIYEHEHLFLKTDREFSFRKNFVVFFKCYHVCFLHIKTFYLFFISNLHIQSAFFCYFMRFS